MVDGGGDREEYIISSMGSRLKAYLIDDTIVSLFIFAIFYDQFMDIFRTYQVDGDIAHLLLFMEQNSLVMISLRIIYQTFFIWQYGMTIGKMLSKTRVVELNEATQSITNPTFKSALIRAVFRVVSDTILYIGYLLAYFSPLNQTLHDKLANTIVVDV